jgi:hypothetical protein
MGVITFQVDVTIAIKSDRSTPWHLEHLCTILFLFPIRPAWLHQSSWLQSRPWQYSRCIMHMCADASI